jgi:hypothetical protein
MKHPVVTQALRDTQKRIRGLLTQAHASKSRAPELTRGAIREACMEIEVYVSLEEEILYPELQSQVSEAETFVALGKERLKEFKGTASKYVEPSQMPSDEDFLLFSEKVLAHFEAENSNLFPLEDRLDAARSQALLERIHQRQEELLRNPKYQGARASEVQNPHGGEQKRKSSAA